MKRYEDPILRETLYTETLPSGLPVLVVPRPGFKQATATFTTHYGSVDRVFLPPGQTQPVEVPDGIAHFLEHKLFESEEGDAMSKFSALGAHSNAYTTWEQTAYYFTTTSNFSQCLDLLLDMVQKPWFTDESVAKEQGIISQEIRQYRDDPGARSVYGLLEAMYQRHPIRIDIAGTVESIGQITKDLLYECHRTFYHPSNLVLVAVGDLDPAQVFEQVARNVEGYHYRPQGQIRRVFEPEPADVGRRRAQEELVVAQPILRLGFKDDNVGYGGERLQRRDLLSNILLDAMLGKSSPLYTELYEAGLIDQRFGYEYEGSESYGWTIIGGPSRDPAGLEQHLREGIERTREQGLDADSFERAKKKNMGRFLSAMSSSDTIVHLWNQLYFKGMDMFQWIPIGRTLTVDEANDRLRRHFNPDTSVALVINPRR